MKRNSRTQKRSERRMTQSERKASRLFNVCLNENSSDLSKFRTISKNLSESAEKLTSMTSTTNMLTTTRIMKITFSMEVSPLIFYHLLTKTKITQVTTMTNLERKTLARARMESLLPVSM